MYNLRSIGKMMIKCFLLTGNNDKIDPYVAEIKVYLLIIILHISHFNAPKSVLYIETLAASQQITLSRSMMSRKKVG